MVQDIFAPPPSSLVTVSGDDMPWQLPSAEQMLTASDLKEFIRAEQLPGSKQGKSWSIAEECCVMIGIRLLMCRAIDFRLVDKRGNNEIPPKEGVFGLLGVMYFSRMFPMRYKHSPDGMKARTYTQHVGSNGGWKGLPKWTTTISQGSVVKHCYCARNVKCRCEGTVTLESVKQLMDDFGSPQVGGGMFYDAPTGWVERALSILACVLNTVHVSPVFAERVRLIKDMHDPKTYAAAEGTISFGNIVLHVYSFGRQFEFNLYRSTLTA
jgi:hypothetical protein